MTEKEFLEEMAEIMDTEADVGMDSCLDNLEDWDSLAYISFMSLCATKGRRKVVASEVREAKTVRDLYNLIAGEDK